MFKLVYKKKALKALAKMPRKIARQFLVAFDRLAASGCLIESREAGLDIKKLSGREGYRLRIGTFRAIYQQDGEQLIILVLDAGPRGDIYK